MTLEKDVCTQTFSHLASHVEAFAVRVAACGSYSVELSRMRCHDDVVGKLVYPCAVRSEHVEGVSVEDDGACGLLELRHESKSRTFLTSESRSDAHGVEVVCGYSLRVIVLTVEHEHGFGHSHLHDVIVGTWRESRHLANAAAQTCSCGKRCGSCHAVCAGDDERVSHHSLVGEVVTRAQVVLYVALLDDVEFSGDALYVFL